MPVNFPERWWELPCPARLEWLERCPADGAPLALEGLRALLADNTPYTFERGRSTYVGEVRLRALEKLQSFYHHLREPLHVSPVSLVRAEPVEAVKRAGELTLQARSPEEQQRVLQRAYGRLRSVYPVSPAENIALLHWMILQDLGELEYRVEAVDPVSGLTPWQREVFASQVRARRPTPCLEIGSPSGEVFGFVFRENGVWIFDFQQSPAAQDAARLGRRFLTELDRRGIPLVRRDASGGVVRDEQGRLFFDGVVPLNSPNPKDVLLPLSAFLEREWRVRLLEDEPTESHTTASQPP